MVLIIDYGMGNCGSILNMLKKIGVQAIVSSEYEDVKNANKLILPGVGIFDKGMENIAKLGLLPVLQQKVITEKTPILGICLGLQLFTMRSQEGKLSGFGWLNAETVRFSFNAGTAGFKVPHMGWNSMEISKPSRLFNAMFENPRFYFAHSYHLVCRDTQDILTKTRYGYDFVSSVEKGNILGTQFHPEKSHKFGMNIFYNFMNNY